MFNSLEDLPLKNCRIQETLRLESEKPLKINNNEDSTASREHGRAKKKYSKPNNEYFGMRTSLSRELDHPHRKKKSKENKMNSKLSNFSKSHHKSRSNKTSSNKSLKANLTKSLGKKIKEYRAL